MQSCDATCSWCWNNFVRWWKAREKSAQREAGRSGAGSFSAAAATSIIADRQVGVTPMFAAAPF